MKKKLSFNAGMLRLIFIMSLALACMLIPIAVSADDTGNEVGTIYWAVDEGNNLTISDTVIEGVTQGSFAADASFWNSPWGDKVVSVKVQGNPKPIYASNWFRVNFKIIDADLRGLDLSACKSISGMFFNCSNLKSVNLTGIDTSSCEDMSYLFGACDSLELDESIYDLDTGNCTTVKNMFSSCRKLESIDLSRFDLSKCIDFNDMFAGCFNIKSVNLSGVSTGKCVDLSWMFFHCMELTEVDFSSMDLSECEGTFDVLANCIGVRTIKMGSTYTNGGIYFPFDEHATGCWVNTQTGKYYYGDVEIPAGAGTYTFINEGPAGYDAYWALTAADDGCYDLVISPDPVTGDLSGKYNTAIDPWGWEKAEGCSRYNISSVTFKPGADGSKVKYTNLSYSVYIDDGYDYDHYVFGLFREYYRLRTADLRGLDSSEATDMENLFLHCQNLATIDMSPLDTSSCTNMSGVLRMIYPSMVIVGPKWKNPESEPGTFWTSMYRADDGSYTEFRDDSVIPSYSESEAGCNIYVSDAKKGELENDEDFAAALEVAKQITALGDITSTDQKPDVEAARAAYEALSEKAKSYIPGVALNNIDDAEAAIAELEAAESGKGDPKPQPQQNTADPLKVGDNLTQGYLLYTVTDATKKTVSVRLTDAGKKKAKTVKIPGEVTIKNTACKVTSIPARGFAGTRKLKSVKGGSSIETIGARSFAKGKKLKTVSISSASLSKIGSKAFTGCKKLKKLQFKRAAGLSKAGVKNSLKGSKVKSVKVAKKMKKAYKKIFTKKACGKKVKVK